MFFKIGVLKSFENFTGRHLCWSLFLKNLQTGGLQLYLKRDFKQLFSCEVCESLKNTFFNRTAPVTASAPPVAASDFFLEKVTKNSYFATLLWRTNILFFSIHSLM